MAVILGIRLTTDPTKEAIMSVLRIIPRTIVPLIIGLLIFTVTKVLAASAPLPLSQLALYQAADREKILIEGARKEGQLTFYNSHTWFKNVAQEFEKKYPFIKVAVWRADGPDVQKKVTEEHLAGRFLVDVIESTEANIQTLQHKGLLQEHTSPQLRYFDKEVVSKGKRGVYYWADRETYISLGFNTTHVPVAEAPRISRTFLTPNGKARCPLPAALQQPAGLAQ
jgi:iron(III) transport system substrate-binding protein